MPVQQRVIGPFPIRCIVRFDQWPKTLREAVSPEYVVPGVANNCPARQNRDGTVTIRSCCLANAPTITIPAHLAAIPENPATPAAPQASDPMRPPQPQPRTIEIDQYLEALPS